MFTFCPYSKDTVVVTLTQDENTGEYHKVVGIRPEWAPTIASTDSRIKNYIVADVAGIPEESLDSTVRRLVNAGIDVPGFGRYYASGAGSAAKSGRLHLYPIKGATQEWFYKKPSAAVRMGVKHTPLHAGLCEMKAHVRLVKTGEFGTGDGQAHASVAWMKAIATKLGYKGPLTLLQIRFNLQECIDVDFKGTIIPDENITDCDIVFPDSCVKGNVDKLGEEASLHLICGGVGWAVAHDFSIGYQVSQYWGKEIQSAINRTWTRNSDEITKMANDPAYFASTIPAAGVRNTQGKLDFPALYKRLADVCYDTGSIDLIYTAYWVKWANDSIRQLNINQTVAGGLKARGLKGVANAGLPQDVIAINPKDFTEAQRERFEAVAGRSPHTDPTETMGVRVQWHDSVLRGCVELHPDLAAIMAGDFDGDEYFIHIVQDEVGQAWHKWLGTLDRKLTGEKRRKVGGTEGDVATFLMNNLTANIGEIDSILSKLHLVSPGDARRPMVRDELQTEIDRAKHGGETNWAFLREIQRELKEQLTPEDMLFREMSNGTTNVWGYWGDNRAWKASKASGKPMPQDAKAVVLPWDLGCTNMSWLGEQFNTRARSLPVPALQVRDNRLVVDYLPKPDKKSQGAQWAFDRYGEMIRDLQLISIMKDAEAREEARNAIMDCWEKLWSDQLTIRTDAWLIQASRALWHACLAGDSGAMLMWTAIPEITLDDLEANTCKKAAVGVSIELIGPVAITLPRHERLFGRIEVIKTKHEKNGNRAINWNNQTILVRGNNIPQPGTDVWFWPGDNKHTSTLAGVLSVAQVSATI